jgi:hypothetical protein
MNILPTTLALIALSLPAGAALIPFDLQGQAGTGLLAGNETGAVGGTPGSGGEIGGGITFDDASKVLTISVGWGTGNMFSDLTGAANGAHIHGPANIATPFTTNAGVVVDFIANTTPGAGFSAPSFTVNTSATNGSVTGTVTLDATREAQLMASQLYINIHTPTNGGGEIRGNLVVVPEPSSIGLAALGLFGVGLGRRIRRRQANSV